MASVDDLLNIISDFKCQVGGQEIVFPGVLQKENKNVILNAKLPTDQCRKVTQEGLFILGCISGVAITLVDCYIKSISCNYGIEYASIMAVPNEIIIGGLFSSAPKVKEIRASTPDLNYMFLTKSPLKENFAFNKDNPSVLNYTFPKRITASDKYGKIELYQTIGFSKSVNSYTHNIICVIDYCFTEPLPLMEAVEKLSAIRNLFSFFGNGYISLGEISFKTNMTEDTCDLWLNYREDVPAVNEPYFVTISKFENQFQLIWEKWLAFYERANPVSTLFYEIICNRSTRVNGFLNLSQAIEVYSNTFRVKEANAIAKKDIHNTSKRKDTHLKHRYEDILSAYNNVFTLHEANIGHYAYGLSEMRNYYTHYNSKSNRKPSYEELVSAKHILRFVLLTIVYSTIGIPLDSILECKEHFNNIDRDFDRILKYSQK